MNSTRTPWSFARSSSPGAGLVVLEAMKMENELKAPAPAVIRAVRVQPGAAVEKGQVLLEFEDSAGP
jgi:biotin carboxyl carrier protein